MSNKENKIKVGLPVLQSTHFPDISHLQSNNPRPVRPLLLWRGVEFRPPKLSEVLCAHFQNKINATRYSCSLSFRIPYEPFLAQHSQKRPASLMSLCKVKIIRVHSVSKVELLDDFA